MVRIAAAALIAVGLACSSGRNTGEDGRFSSGSDTGRDGGFNYSYPGCEDAGFYGCEGLLQLYCAARLIQDKHNACSTGSDCASLWLQNCAGAFQCPPAAVNIAQQQAFEAEIDVEMGRYCAGGCWTAGLCAYSYASGQVDCVNGRCVAIADDAGTP
jgi:hypothetical protein